MSLTDLDSLGRPIQPDAVAFTLIGRPGKDVAAFMQRVRTLLPQLRFWSGIMEANDHPPHATDAPPIQSNPERPLYKAHVGASDHFFPQIYKVLSIISMFSTSPPLKPFSLQVSFSPTVYVLNFDFQSHVRSILIDLFYCLEFQKQDLYKGGVNNTVCSAGQSGRGTPGTRSHQPAVHVRISA